MNIKQIPFMQILTLDTNNLTKIKVKEFKGEDGKSRIVFDKSHHASFQLTNDGLITLRDFLNSLES